MDKKMIREAAILAVWMKLNNPTMDANIIANSKEIEDAVYAEMEDIWMHMNVSSRCMH